MSQTESKKEEISEERKAEVLNKFKTLLIKAARKQRLQKLIETKRREQGIDIKENENDSPFVPCSDDCINKFMEIAEPNKNDIIVDLGCGDARLLIQCALKYKCKCIGIEIQKKVIEKANENISKNNVSDLVKVIECDFKSSKCKQILNKASIVFIFLLPKIMPMVTNILSNSVNDKCKVVSYIFDLARIKMECIKSKRIQLRKWSFPTLSPTELEYRQNFGIYLTGDIHPDIKKEVNGVYGEYKLIEINGRNILDQVKNEYDFICFKRGFHCILSDYYQYRHNENDERTLNLVIEYIEYGDDCETVTQSLAKPTKMIEVVKKFKNGSEIRSDIKLYEFPLDDNDFGWINPNGASRIVHAK